MLEEGGGWSARGDYFGKMARFEDPDDPFPQIGINIFVLEPGKPNCRYHRENAQEDLLVLSGRCETWDFVHFPAGTSHVVVGLEEPCAVLFVGHREEPERLFYPASELARRYRAEAPEPTPDPNVAYADAPHRTAVEPPPWPLR